MNLFDSIHQFNLILIELAIFLGSLGVVLSANVVHSAFSLALVFTGISLLYFALNADSVAAVQLLVYVGAINVLIVFAVMVIDEPACPSSTIWGVGHFAALVACLALFLVLINMINTSTKWFYGSFINESHISSTCVLKNDTQQLGHELLNKFIIPFELTSALLLVVLVGAITLARDDETMTIDEKSSVFSSYDKSSFF
uniref:NAD(P)H-quinone oxidoreductase subunit 6, chloroplastic n=1 Tax=Lindsaea linearis TaxID=641179 RepID=A0A5B9RAE9_9MONI|nr:NADH-plastoquinone oxidoreductase subunit 6 [Lindsaea linearis]QEG57401.1 NADH-plastoquinone oxidoreductase subunit 6 [Lindsaea linearis]